MEKLGEILSRSVSAGSSGPADDARTAASQADAPAACGLCGGAGFVRRELALDHPRFGRAEPCACVLHEAEDERVRRLTRLSNLAHLSRYTMASLSEPGDEPRLIPPRALETAAAFLETHEGWLVITGRSGAGKTVLAAAVANERVRRGEPALFMVVPDLLDHLRAGYSAGEGELSYEDVLEQVRNSPFLVLDDLDSAAATDWAREKLFQVINHRHMADLPTVVTCASVDRLEDRLATRLRGRDVVRIELARANAEGSYEQVGGMTAERIAMMTFANFDLRGAGLQPEERESLQAGHRAARTFADGPRGFLTLLGVNGCGKTHLAAAVAGRVLAAGGSAFFAVVPDLLDHLRASFAPGRETAYDDTFERVRTADLLVLDDLAAQASSPWAQEKLFQIVNYRTVAGMATVITSDRDRDQLAAAHPRIAARIFDPRVGVTIGILAPHYSLGRATDTRPRHRR